MRLTYNFLKKQLIENGSLVGNTWNCGFRLTHAGLSALSVFDVLNMKRTSHL